MDFLPLIIVAACIIGVTAIAFRMLSGSRAAFLSSDTSFIPLRLVRKVQVSPDTRIFRFALETPEQILGLPVGQHLSLRATVGNEVITRSYTPISSDDDKGFFELIIKVYFANVHPKFPAGGAMTQHMEKLKIGDTIDVKGCGTGRFDYVGNGTFRIKQAGKSTERQVKRIGLLAGGSGVSPCLALIRHVLKNPSDRTEMWLLFANQTEQDVLLRSELEECAKDPRFHLWYTLDRPPQTGWTYSSGFIDLDMITQHMPPPGSGTVILMCGPPPMIQYACKPNLEKRGFTADQLYAF